MKCSTTTNSEGCSLEQAKAPSNVIKLVVWRRLPSNNEILSMSLWQRMREKLLTKAAVLSALRASADACAMSETSGTNTLSMRLWKAAASLETGLMTRKSKSGRSKFQSQGRNEQRLR